MNLKVLLKLHQKVINIIFWIKLKSFFSVFTVDITELQRTLTSIKARVNNAQTYLDNAKTDSTSDEDLFVEVIKVFLIKYKERINK